jgi:xylan 1,4-beta-xylosidase
MAKFDNPVVRGVAPDPSVCRVGADFFLATSTFDFWPGIPIRHSTDLVHWELIGHAATRPDQLRPDGGPGDFVLFAATLRYHDGTFFVACTNAAPRDPARGLAGGTIGNFIVHTDDPAGRWSQAAWVDAPAFDPSLTFADGTCYYTRRSLDLADVPAGLGPIVQGEVDPRTGALSRNPAPITTGETGFCSNDIEGPHLYKIGGWYYLFSAEGGTEKGHMQTIARSRSPYGPFQPAPHNPVLTHRHLVMHPIQCTGHAELVEAPDGTWWALFLATRADRLQGPDLLGRETFLAPVSWRDGWPVIGDDGTVSLEFDAPALPVSAGRAASSPWLNGWSTRQYPADGLSISGRRIEIPVTAASLDDSGAVSAAFLRQLEHRSSFEATVVTSPAGAAAGITAYTGPEHHFDLTVSGTGPDRRATLRRSAADLTAERTVPLPGAGPVRLTVDCDGTEYRFTADGTAAGSGAARLLDAQWAPGFGSVRLGVFASGPEPGLVVFEGVGGEHAG